jgi:primase-polymerase (primpol)-like protein
MTLTGHHLHGTPATIEHRREALAAFHKQVFPKDYQTRPAFQPQSTGGITVRLDDRLILEKAMRAANGARFAALYSGDIAGYSSHSEADMALTSYLAFWCGGNPVQVDRLFRESGLFREKWDEKHGVRTYGEMTLAKVLAGGREVYTPFPKTTRGVIKTINVEVA